MTESRRKRTILLVFFEEMPIKGLSLSMETAAKFFLNGRHVIGGDFGFGFELVLIFEGFEIFRRCF
jgi:hypothetical protein